jgi:hypothetical protein
VIVELSPVTYLALCGLVDDALMNRTDATPLLKRVAEELRSATAAGMMPSELLEEPARLEALRRAGFVGR